jgi:hypothetical protein
MSEHFHEYINRLAIVLATKYRIPAPPPLSRKQTAKAESEIRKNALTRDEYLQAAAQTWEAIHARQRIYPKPYLLLSPVVIQQALSNRTDRDNNQIKQQQAVTETLEHWVIRYAEAHPRSTIQEAIHWLEFDGVHRQFPDAEYSAWKSQKLPLK